MAFLRNQALAHFFHHEPVDLRIREISRQSPHVLDRRLVGATMLAKFLQLSHKVSLGLSSQARKVRRNSIAINAVAIGANLKQRLTVIFRTTEDPWLLPAPLCLRRDRYVEF